jgi:hypothetical protein
MNRANELSHAGLATQDNQRVLDKLKAPAGVGAGDFLGFQPVPRPTPAPAQALLVTIVIACLGMDLCRKNLEWN